MKLIVGLGNPGKKYTLTKHNIGFLALDWIIQEWQAEPLKNAFHSNFFQQKQKNCFFLKPQTFMNESGSAVKSCLQFYKIPITDLIVIHDDMSLLIGKMKLKIAGSAGGHNGIRSIDQHLSQDQNYTRIKIGIGHPRTYAPHQDPADYVLTPFEPEHQCIFPQQFAIVAQALEYLIHDEHIERAKQCLLQPL